MLRKFIGLMIIAPVILMGTTGCVAIAGGNPNGYGPNGFLVSLYKVGLSGSETNAPKGKKGSACAMKVLFFIIDPGGGVPAAARGAGISKIHSVDIEVFSVLNGLYAQSCTVITGE